MAAKRDHGKNKLDKTKRPSVDTRSDVEKSSYTNNQANLQNQNPSPRETILSPSPQLAADESRGRASPQLSLWKPQLKVSAKVISKTNQYDKWPASNPES